MHDHVNDRSHRQADDRGNVRAPESAGDRLRVQTGTEEGNHDDEPDNDR
jgi:hypothetical protein